MQKQFSIRMPDELYVPGFTQTKTATFTYDGPSTISVVVTRQGDIVGLANPDLPPVPEDSFEYVVDIDASVYPQVAHYIVNTDPDVDYVYEDILNHDGSVYKQITNPRLQDVYRLKYNEGATGETTSTTGHTTGLCEFVLITKDKTTIGEITVKRNLDLVKSKLQDVALDTADQTTYNNFITASETYLTTMSTVYPWKYVEITTPEVPKLPISLVRAMNELPG